MIILTIFFVIAAILYGLGQLFRTPSVDEIIAQNKRGPVVSQQQFANQIIKTIEWGFQRKLSFWEEKIARLEAKRTWKLAILAQRYAAEQGEIISFDEALNRFTV